MQPNTIGLALNDNPLGQLAWIGEKFLECSFCSVLPAHQLTSRPGTDPNGDLSHQDVLAGVSLYYLTESFHSSVFQYAYNPAGFAPTTRKANNNAPMAYGNFKWDVGCVLDRKLNTGQLTRFTRSQWPRYFVEELGNLVFYRREFLLRPNAHATNEVLVEHERGGHFPGTDNPVQYVTDVRDFLAESFLHSQ